MNPALLPLFHHARELPPGDERQAYLEAACAGDAAMRADVEALLTDAGQADDYFNEATTVVSPRLAGEEAGEVIGPYKLLQQIGEGGFGAVWMAEQQRPVRRRVALKIIKAGMDTRQVVARFEQERQALAMMDHPNIARVFDAGATQSGRPYFVMELVKGIPVTRFCDEQRLPVKARLALFMEVCLAIQHAHQKGIIHRDIKPANILVALLGDEPVLKVIDFGIAKATQQSLTDKTLFTRFEQFIGTPAYMSPEQASGGVVDVDTRSDIYALGILLYELLTGKPPFDPASLVSASYDDMRRVICESEPPRPSARISTVAGAERTELARSHQVEPARLGQLIRGDLDWIVMRAIEKDRNRRYDSANSLVADIRRYLADEPVSATPPGAVYLFRKFARRHRLAFVVSASVAAALVLGLGVSTWMFLREKAARQRADVAEGHATEVSGFLLSMIRSPAPNRDGPRITVAEVLDKAELQLAGAFPQQPEKLAVMQETLGTSYGALGLPAKGIPHLQKALAYAEEVQGPGAEQSCELRAALAMLYISAGRQAEGVSLIRSVYEWQRRTLGPDSPVTIGRMLDLAKAWEALGVQFGDTAPEQIPLLTEVVERSEKLPGQPHRLLIQARSQLARAHLTAERYQEALSAGTLALEASRARHDPADIVSFDIMQTIILAHCRLGQPQQGLELAEEALSGSRRDFGARHTVTGTMAAALGWVFDGLGRTDDAIRLWQESVSILPAQPSLVTRLAHALYERERYQEVLSTIRAAQAFYADGGVTAGLAGLRDKAEAKLKAAVAPASQTPPR